MHLKKLCRVEEGVNIFGVFRVKTHDFTTKNHIFSNFRGGGMHQVHNAPPDLFCYLWQLKHQFKGHILEPPYYVYNTLLFINCCMPVPRFLTSYVMVFLYVNECSCERLLFILLILLELLTITV
jgi:hypothetical protein